MSLPVLSRESGDVLEAVHHGVDQVVGKLGIDELALVLLLAVHMQMLTASTAIPGWTWGQQGGARCGPNDGGRGVNDAWRKQCWGHRHCMRCRLQRRRYAGGEWCWRRFRSYSH